MQFDSELEKTVSGLTCRNVKTTEQLKLNATIEEQDGILPGRETNLIFDVHIQYSKEQGSVKLSVKARN